MDKSENENQNSNMSNSVSSLTDNSLSLYSNSTMISKQNTFDTTSKEEKQRRNEKIVTSAEVGDSNGALEIKEDRENKTLLEQDNDNMYGHCSTSWIIDMSSSSYDLPKEVPRVKESTSDAKKSSYFFVALSDLDVSKATVPKKLVKKTKDMDILNNNEAKDLYRRIFFNGYDVPGLHNLFLTYNKEKKLSNADRSIIENCGSSLGRHLLSFFFYDIGTDVTLQVSSRRIRAHKYILSSRCQYFAGLFAGGYVESVGNNIRMPSFSYNTIHFTICHIYSGISNIPDNVDILELASFADLLCLYGLKDVIANAFQIKYCHNFHSPCTGCTSGVLECYPLTYTYNLEELSIKCVKWIATYFYVIWRTEAFGTLPKYLLNICYQQQLKQFQLENLLHTLHGCAIIAQGLESGLWADDVLNMNHRLVADIASLIAVELEKALRIIVVDVVSIPNECARTVQECVLNAIKAAPLNEACSAFQYLTEELNVITEAQVGAWFKIMKRWQRLCEKKMVSGFAKGSFYDILPKSMKMKLNALSLFEAPSQPLTPRESKRAIKKTFENMRPLFVPYAELPVQKPTGVVRTTMIAKSAVFTEKIPRAELETSDMAKERSSGASSINTNRFSHIKSRYLDVPSRSSFENIIVRSSTKEYSPKAPNNYSRKNTPASKSQHTSGSISQFMMSQQSTESATTTTSNRFATITKSRSTAILYMPKPPYVKKSGPTKIPMAQIYFQKPQPVEVKPQPVPEATVKPSTSQYISPRLLSTTKSSAAKANTIVSNNKSKKSSNTKVIPKRTSSGKKEMPKVMQRSGTFSKE